jgi:hypothetical protein
MLRARGGEGGGGRRGRGRTNNRVVRPFVHKEIIPHSSGSLDTVRVYGIDQENIDVLRTFEVERCTVCSLDRTPVKDKIRITLAGKRKTDVFAAVPGRLP